MNNKILIGIGVVVIFLVGGFAVAHRFTSTNNTNQTAQDTKPEQTQREGDDPGQSNSEAMTDETHPTQTSPAADLLDLTDQAEVTMDIKGFAYSKPNIKIKKGTMVTWTNQDIIVKHSAMRDHEHSDEAHAAPTREQVKPDVFSGPLLVQGESYSFVFTTAEAISYHCAPHPFMKGIITVVE